MDFLIYAVFIHPCRVVNIHICLLLYCNLVKQIHELKYILNLLWHIFHWITAFHLKLLSSIFYFIQQKKQQQKNLKMITFRVSTEVSRYENRKGYFADYGRHGLLKHHKRCATQHMKAAGVSAVRSETAPVSVWRITWMNHYFDDHRAALSYLVSFWKDCI